MSGKSLRLSFKGEKPAKKKNKKKSASAGDSKGKRKADDDVSDVEDIGGDEQAWVSAERPADINGPTFLFHQPSSSSTPYAISVNITTQRVELVPCSTQDLDASSANFITDADGTSAVVGGIEITPTSVYQVFVANRQVGSDKLTFRDAEGKFLGADRMGQVSASAEARGPQEEWEVLTHAQAAIAAALASTAEGEEKKPPPPDLGLDSTSLFLRSMYGHFLGVDEVAGGRKVLRADAEAPGQSERWEVRLQWKFRHEARMREREGGALVSKKAKGSDMGTAGTSAGPSAGLADEHALMRSRVALTGGRVLELGKTSADRKALRQAEKEGRLAEVMLDRREKMKSDRYAK
ncbi:unnamed protein product [Tilletia controversa]|uniref:Protein FRG1 n=3 Tax=Tilletia TaxID=13289 RepID=A0A8X7T0H7_9BASI|nr:hypothetical protein CF328_g3747 [Tilletia controversa]KAE8264257.1 hypothetical protein A4X03_0g1078 [Tilletia caries]CAD6901367.1 unnamed protein product [Tilletia laevis]KAE8254024.1 hypothetical protein A4X06_0g1108 [Tilletia controversa]CAD6889518.1 unnamed protein product [Tilletia caries]